MQWSISKFGSRLNRGPTHSGKKGNEYGRVRADFLSGRLLSDWGGLHALRNISWAQIPDRVGHGHDGWSSLAGLEVEDLRAERRGAAIVHRHCTGEIRSSLRLHGSAPDCKHDEIGRMRERPERLPIGRLDIHALGFARLNRGSNLSPAIRKFGIVAAELGLNRARVKRSDDIFAVIKHSIVGRFPKLSWAADAHGTDVVLSRGKLDCPIEISY